MSVTIRLNPETDIIASIARPKRIQTKSYNDHQFNTFYPGLGDDGRERLLQESSTVYVGNLSFYTSESQLYELFARCGDIKRVIMGLDKFKKTPCGFCFVEYEERISALNCLNTLNYTYLDGRQLKIDIDTGFVEGRQYGRGQGGGQLADERRNKNNNDGGPSPGTRGRRPAYATYGMQIIMCFAVVIYCCSMFSVSSPIEPQHHTQATNTYRLRRIQTSTQGMAFEQYFARLLVDFMKVSKPTLMQAFMRATLEDPKLKETAIGIFFNASSTS